MGADQPANLPVDLPHNAARSASGHRVPNHIEREQRQRPSDEAWSAAPPASPRGLLGPINAGPRQAERSAHAACAHGQPRADLADAEAGAAFPEIEPQAGSEADAAVEI